MWRTLALLYICPLLALSGGCAWTSSLWAHAKSNTLRPDMSNYGQGPSTWVLEGCLLDRSSNPARVRALVAAYRCDYQLPFLGPYSDIQNDFPYAIGLSHKYVLIPIDADGIAISPFGYRGGQRNWEQEWESVKQEVAGKQLTAIREIQFDAQDYSLGSAAIHSRDFLRIGNNAGIQRGRVSGCVGCDDHWGHGALMVEFINAGHSQLLILPTSQPRPARDRDQNISFAVGMTPVALVADGATIVAAVAMAPIVIPAIYLRIIPIG
jgi:hypothetical protein